jgi:hypothetical protein
MNELATFTDWKARRKGQVKTIKESERVRGTHVLESASGGTSQGTTRKRVSERHSHPGDRIVRYKSGHEKKASE